MSKSLIRKSNNKDSHLKGAFTEAATQEVKKKDAMLRVDEDVKDEVNAIVQVLKLGKANDLIMDMLDMYKASMTDEEKQKLELLKELKK